MSGEPSVASGGTAAALRCIGLRKRFGATVALDGFDLEVCRGEVLVLFGPSGCGKTTALRVVAGIERPDAGEVWIGGRRVTDGEWVPPERRHVGMVFQDWALFPHLDVWHNVAFGLRDKRDERVREILTLVQMEGFERHMPHELSGGQQQRVALARALAPSPEVILLDEPFSNLDASLRSELRTEVRSVLAASGATAVFVTHDREEALSLADRIAVMVDGRVVQVGTPYEVYAAPATASVASLIGEANLLPARVRDGLAETPLGPVPATGAPDGDADMLVRPEDISLDVEPGAPATVTAVEFYGHDQLVRVRLADGTPLAVRTGGYRPAVGEGMAVRVSLAGRPRFFPREGAT
jgi:iron(III) transport system ATP-binding protein